MPSDNHRRWITAEDDLIRKAINAFKGNPIVVFPQTLFFEDSDVGLHSRERFRDGWRGHSNLVITLRDLESFTLASELADGSEVSLHHLPDMALYLEEESAHEEPRRGVLLCLRSDRERVLQDEQVASIRAMASTIALGGGLLSSTDTIVRGRVDRTNRVACLERKLDEFRGAELVITDRLHGMLFAAITGTPCIAFDNVSRKVSGVHRWIENLSYVRVIEALEELPAAAESLAKVGAGLYDASFLEPRYDELADIFRESMSRSTNCN